MTKVVYATFDGEVFRPEEPVSIEPNTRVKVTIEADPGAKPRPASFLATARSLMIEGPPDWSERLDQYLYEKPCDDV